MEKMNIKLISIVGLFLFIAISINIQIIGSFLETNNSILMIPENTPNTLDNYFKIMVGTSTWSELFSKQTKGFDFLSYRLYFTGVAKLINLNLTQLLLSERVIFSFLAFFGTFLLSRDYLLRYSKRKNDCYILIPSFIAGLIYGLNPSFMIADSFWMGIQFSFVSFPWIIWSFNKVLLDKKWNYSFLCAVIMSINIDEHFLWVGYPLFLGVYSGSFFILNKLKKEINFIHSLKAFLITFLIFICLSSYRLINNLMVISTYSLSYTKAAVDICWSQASIVNMLRAMSHMSIPVIYSGNNGIEFFLNSTTSLALLIPVLALISLLFKKRNFIIIFYTMVLLGSILIFFNGSPFKNIHYWIFFNLPFGPIFRTWRIPDAYISLSLSILTSFSIYYIFSYFYSKQDISSHKILHFNRRASYFIKYLKLKVLIIMSITLGMLLLISIYSWPLMMGDANGMLNPIEVPEEYSDVQSFLADQSIHSRVLYIPEFTFSYGKDSLLKPFWSSDWGAIQEYLTYSSFNPTLLPTGQWAHFYDFTVSPFYISSLIRNNETKVLSRFLTTVNIIYLVIHNDIEAKEEDIDTIITNLNQSKYFRLIYNKNFVYVFHNLVNKPKITTDATIILVDAGYRAVQKLYYADDTNNIYNFLYIDQGIPKNILEKVKIILLDKPRNQLERDLIFSFKLYNDSIHTIYPYNFVIEHDPHKKWSRASFLDSHQQVWHPYVNMNNYAWDFDYNHGLAFTINSNDTLKIPLNIESSGNYILLARYFKNTNGGKINIQFEEESFGLDTIGDYNGFFWHEISIKLSDSNNDITIKNIRGLNAISALCLIPDFVYEKLSREANNYISSRQVIDHNLNLIKNPSFEKGLDNWEMDEDIRNYNYFDLNIDNSIKIDGTNSLKVETNLSKAQNRWSWIRSTWINVTEEEEFKLITHMKTSNINASHIVLEAYNSIENRSISLGQVPSAQYKSFDWRTYQYKFIIPKGISKIRVILNSGLSDNDENNGITWFDDIRLIPLKSKQITVNLSEYEFDSDELIKYSKICPSLWKVEVNTTKPLMLSFGESFNPQWIAEIKTEGTIKRYEPIPLNSIINGYWINETGNLEIFLKYKPQERYEMSAIISILTILGCIAYFVYDWKKNDERIKMIKRKIYTILKKRK